MRARERTIDLSIGRDRARRQKRKENELTARITRDGRSSHPRQVGGLIAGNFSRHMSARHGGSQDPTCRTCTLHREALEHELTRVAPSEREAARSHSVDVEHRVVARMESVDRDWTLPAELRDRLADGIALAELTRMLRLAADASMEAHLADYSTATIERRINDLNAARAMIEAWLLERTGFHFTSGARHS